MDTTDVLVVCKTHLDVGFTDPAAAVVERYLSDHLPAALRTARALREARAVDGESPLLRWTVGSWLVVEALERGDASLRAAVEEAIEHHEIVWHAMPFTIHTELADPPLVRAGLALSERLDERFGTSTVAAKMTDVPGHTRGLVPLLADAGVELLHIGVNPASRPPAVPPLFRWRPPEDDRSVVVAYRHGGYGGETRLPDGSILHVAHTGDNAGPPTDAAVRELYRGLRRRHRDARLLPASLDDAARRIRGATLPEITAEIGDTWIHGAASDPRKLAELRALRRVHARAAAVPGPSTIGPSASGPSASGPSGPPPPAPPPPPSPSVTAVDQRSRAARSLLLVAEHTWGLDEKTHLPDTVTYRPAEVARARARQESWQAFERSWAEQRAYLDDAEAALRHLGWGGEAAAARAATRPTHPRDDGLLDAVEAVDPGSALRGRQVTVAPDPATGALVRVELADGRLRAAPGAPLAAFGYQTFSVGDYERWWRDYVVCTPAEEPWARPDQTKPGIEVVDPPSRWWRPRLVAQHVGRYAAGGGTLDPAGPGDRLVVELRGPEEAVHDHGCPAELWLVVELPDADASLHLELRWFAKQANRLPEASWLSFTPAFDGGSDGAPRAGSTTAGAHVAGAHVAGAHIPGAGPSAVRGTLDKLGRPVDAHDVVPGGGRRLHAVDRGVILADADATFVLETVDAALVAPGRPALLEVDDGPVDLRGGLHVCLHDNVWGTNFPMWFDEAARFRFRISFAPPRWW